MAFSPPEVFNIADYFLYDRVREEKGDRTALILGDDRLTYLEVQQLADSYAGTLKERGVRPEDRVLLALPDGPDFVGAFFGTLKLGAVVVMVNPYLKASEFDYFLDYSRARMAVIHNNSAKLFMGATKRHPNLAELLPVGGPKSEKHGFARARTKVTEPPQVTPTHRDDAAIWLFSGGTTGKPKAVVQSHRSFANTTELYAKGVLGMTEDDVTLSVPKLYFGYATGSNLLFPFSVGGAAVLFAERPTPDILFAHIRKAKPTILINVPTMIHRMVNHEQAGEQDFSCLRLATSAGEALPVELYQRWMETFDVELLDGLGTAEMWHIFISNRPGAARSGTIGQVVPGFDVKVCDPAGLEVPEGEVGEMWVKGASRAIGYWQRMERTKRAFVGEWYRSGDLIARAGDGFISYHGREDDMLKVAGKWVAPAEIEGRLLEHELVKEAAVIGAEDSTGLIKAHAFCAVAGSEKGLEQTLKDWVFFGLEPHKTPRKITFLKSLPRTHLGKVDRGELRKIATRSSGRRQRLRKQRQSSENAS